MPGANRDRARAGVLDNFPGDTGIEWLDSGSFLLQGQRFEILANRGDFIEAGAQRSDDRFFISKNVNLLSKYAVLLRTNKPRDILELGVFRGGSVVFFNLMTKPERMLALELSEHPEPQLDRFVASGRAHGTLRVEYGVDQGDAARVHALAVEHFGEGRCIDLVLDDASHLLAPTRTSFDTLFPMIRKGGSYVVEDFSAAQMGVAAFLDRAEAGDDRARQSLKVVLQASLEVDAAPCHLLAVEAMLASIVAPQLIGKVLVDRHLLRIVRGGADWEKPEPFSLRALAKDHFGLLDSVPSETLSGLLAE